MRATLTVHTIRVWDLPTRVFHWALVACVVGSIATSQIGGNAMPWHFRFGYGIASLLLFRVVWGFAGGRWSRFSAFVYSPATTFRFLKGRGRPEHAIGHNPLGSLSVFAMLAFLVAQVSTGLISDDEIAAAGPLTRFVSNATVSAATSYHKSYGKYVLLALIVLHLLAIAYYLIAKRQNLVRPMLHGDKLVATELPDARDDAVSRVAAAIVFGGCAALVTWVVSVLS